MVFIPQMFLECLLCAQHLGCEQNRQEMRELDSGAGSLVGFLVNNVGLYNSDDVISEWSL